MVDSTFFDETREQSAVKARIVAKFFATWSNVIANAPTRPAKIQYIDLFAGPGRYRDGTPSTPLKVLAGAIEKPAIRGRLVSIFNDGDEANVVQLRAEIGALPGIETLRYPPQVYLDKVDEDVMKLFEETRLIPTFTFIDPWGYKGVSVRLIRAVFKDWGCDCVFFFNYRRINMGLDNKAFRSHMDALFGAERAERLRSEVKGLKASQREALILGELEAAIRERGGKYVLPFRFRGEGGRISHHLVFVSKNVKGYDIMKTIMAGECPCSDEGVPSFEFSESASAAPPLFNTAAPSLRELEDGLLDRFQGRSLSMKEIFDADNVGRVFTSKNYKDALGNLDARGLITTDKPKRRAGTFGDGVTVTFPRRR